MKETGYRWSETPRKLCYVLIPLLIAFLLLDNNFRIIGRGFLNPTIKKYSIFGTEPNATLIEDQALIFNSSDIRPDLQEKSFFSYQLTNSTLYTLCRNSDLFEMLETIQNYEDRFNSRYNYDWVFLNDEPFTEEFQKLISNAVSGTAKFGLIPIEHWSFPESLDIDHMNDRINVMMNDHEGPLPYADSISYRHMCRFESGFFYKHELLLDYDYFWRVEPGVKLYCDINYDIFKEMVENDYKYGFTISTIEYPKTIPSLFKNVHDYLLETDQSNLLNNDTNYSRFIYDSKKENYNLCHFWTNFEIGNLNVFRSKSYNDVFEYLDKRNGFFYERWGDAPIRSIILSLILNQGDIKRFEDIGYKHNPYLQCPQNEEIRLQNRCSCNPKEDFTELLYSCSWFFDRIQKELSSVF
ncbi:glycosyltransferase family 15 protein [[Candida] arabinofermentans NRRL YB-2248]|uniref:Glycosyltransferase family 15 protein n=1 Tax=[Candida] arabinofermentans NRRL YB-2248 TaxID=983967 RepID=A0A1E4SVD6_9ASCO|nr:glycosyltransferase family 15 protein [[Candida] arabinofermentans NRRL YB-2248]